MSGTVAGFGPCWVCHRPFSFNPITVPSFHRQPICRQCIDTANGLRAKEGKPPHHVPDDAYSAIPASDLED